VQYSDQVRHVAHFQELLTLVFRFVHCAPASLLELSVIPAACAPVSSRPQDNVVVYEMNVCLDAYACMCLLSTGL